MLRRKSIRNGAVIIIIFVEALFDGTITEGPKWRHGGLH